MHHTKQFPTVSQRGWATQAVAILQGVPRGENVQSEVQQIPADNARGLTKHNRKYIVSELI